MFWKGCTASFHNRFHGGNIILHRTKHVFFSPGGCTTDADFDSKASCALTEWSGTIREGHCSEHFCCDAVADANDLLSSSYFVVSPPTVCRSKMSYEDEDDYRGKQNPRHKHGSGTGGRAPVTHHVEDATMDDVVIVARSEL